MNTLYKDGLHSLCSGEELQAKDFYFSNFL